MPEKTVRLVIHSIELSDTVISRVNEQSPRLDSGFETLKGEWHLSGSNTFTMPLLATLTPEEHKAFNDLLSKIENRLHAGLMQDIINYQKPHTIT